MPRFLQRLHRAAERGDSECGDDRQHGGARLLECGLGAMLAPAETAQWSQLREHMAAVFRLLAGGDVRIACGDRLTCRPAGEFIRVINAVEAETPVG
jgi:hypothetical protein